MHLGVVQFKKKKRDFHHHEINVTSLVNKQSLHYLELLMFVQQSVILPGEALHLLLHYICL